MRTQDYMHARAHEERVEWQEKISWTDYLINSYVYLVDIKRNQFYGKLLDVDQVITDYPPSIRSLFGKRSVWLHGFKYPDFESMPHSHATPPSTPGTDEERIKKYGRRISIPLERIAVISTLEKMALSHHELDSLVHSAVDIHRVDADLPNAGISYWGLPRNFTGSSTDYFFLYAGLNHGDLRDASERLAKERDTSTNPQEMLRELSWSPDLLAKELQRGARKIYVARSVLECIVEIGKTTPEPWTVSEEKGMPHEPSAWGERVPPGVY